ncbi:MAG: hypothetical protein R3C14_47645 [Caldilineaceae bacterium]
MPGTYRLGFYKQGAGYDLEEFYGAPDQHTQLREGADVIVVADKITNGIDLVLGPDPVLYLPLIAQGR